MCTQNHKIDDEGLERRLKTIAGQPMTKQEVREQRISFVYGQLLYVPGWRTGLAAIA